MGIDDLAPAMKGDANAGHSGRKNCGSVTNKQAKETLP